MGEHPAENTARRRCILMLALPRENRPHFKVHLCLAGYRGWEFVHDRLFSRLTAGRVVVLGAPCVVSPRG
jgi:hypothetical protein